MDKAAKALKIFISYGHEIDVTDDNGTLIYPEPNNESVVLRIKAYLESRGHKVWLDKEKIKPGDDWRRSIYEGVEWSDVALICLSRKAMKPNGVCRDEISIALGVRGGNMFPVKLEALKDSEYPAYLLTRQLFTEFMDWRAHWTQGGIDEAWLDQNLEELAKSLEEKNVGLYGEEMVELKSLLKPWNMNDRLRRLDRGIQTIYNVETKEFENRIVHKFCGRESIFQLFEGRIGQAVRSDSECVLWLKKGPGFGKSRFAAELLYRYYYSISAAYFIEYNQRESLDPHTFVKSVAHQLAQANSAYRKKLLAFFKENQNEINLQAGDPQTLFKKLVVDLLSDEIDGGRATQWILVDALDEATVNNCNEIASLISQNLDRLPPWICFFITSRDKDNAVNRNFSQFTPIDFPDEKNTSDVRDYIINEFEGMNIAVSEELVNALQEKSEGTFLYPEMVFRDLKKNSFTIDDIHNLPKGVGKYIHSQFDRLFGSDIKLYKREIRPMLGFILTSCEPISQAVLKYCLDIRRDSELDDRLEMLGTFFIQSGSADEDTIVPFHKGVIDYCFDKNSSVDYYIYPDEAKEDFANRGLELFKSGALQWTTRTDEEPDIVQRYFLNWLPSHLMNANMSKEAACVLSNFAFLMKRLRFGNVERVLLDYILFRGRLNRISQDSDAYFNVICSNAHCLRRNCKDNPAYKIMLQIATEVADECPVTQAADRWLNPETGDSPCDWFWLNKVKRPKEYQPNPCKMVMENAGNKVKLLSNDDALSWIENGQCLRIWDLETGTCKAVLEGHTDNVNGAIELRSGYILSFSADNTMRIWFSDGTCKAVLEGHTGEVKGAIELRSGNILSWSSDNTLRLWSPDGNCNAVLEGHRSGIKDAIELCSGDILSWDDRIMRVWSPDGNCKAVNEGRWCGIKDAIELRSGDILSWDKDITLRLWSPDGNCKAALKGHTDSVWGAIELRSGDILSWSRDDALRLWSPDGNCKAVLKGHTDSVRGAIELRSGDILSWSGNYFTSEDCDLRVWSPDGTCKALLEGHAKMVKGAIELRSGDILSWSRDDALRLWSPDGNCKAVLKGHKYDIEGAKELGSGDILSWSDDRTLRLWSIDGASKVVQEGHKFKIKGTKELRSGDILSWSDDKTLRLWSIDGTCKAVLEGHTDEVSGAIELNTGDILSWSGDDTMRIWSPDGTCKAILKGQTSGVIKAIELRSGKILSWSYNNRLTLWSHDGTCEIIWSCNSELDMVFDFLELSSGIIIGWNWFNSWDDQKYNKWGLHFWYPDGTRKIIPEPSHKINGMVELDSGDILSIEHKTFHIWSPDGTCKETIESDTPQYDSYYALLHPKQVPDQIYSKETGIGIELQYDFKPIARWNSPSCDSRFVSGGRIYVWYGSNIEFLQLNYGNHMSVSFDQAHQLLAGEIDESKLVRYVPEPKESEAPETEQKSTPAAETEPTPIDAVETKQDVNENDESVVQPKRGFFSWLFGLFGWK